MRLVCQYRHTLVDVTRNNHDLAAVNLGLCAVGTVAQQTRETMVV